MARRAARWALLLAVAVGLTLGLDALGVPSAALVAGMATGLGWAFVSAERFAVPEPVTHAAFAVTGVLIGELMSRSALAAIGGDLLALSTSLVGTLALTVVGGYLMAGLARIDRPTAVLGSMAGGTAGMIAISDGVGADSRLVAVMQYLRVLLVLVSIPLVTAVAITAGIAAPHEAAVADVAPEPVLPGVLFAAVAALVGGVLGGLSRIPSGTLLGPMVLVGALALAAPELVRHSPEVLQELAVGVIGLRIGLQFDRERLRHAASRMVGLLGMIVTLVAGCGVVALGLAAWTGRPFFDCYLATTPGGLNAVLATAVHTDADGAFITAVQVLRVFVLMLVAPLLGLWLRRTDRP